MGTLAQKRASLLSQAAGWVNGGAGRCCNRWHTNRPRRAPGAAGTFVMWAGCYLLAGSFACLIRNLRMLLIPSCARRVLAGALRTLARSLALFPALERLAPGV
jgi:hypothetical protein